MKQNKSSYIKIKCDKCKNEQVIFDKASRNIDCLVCDKPLAKATGGKAKILATIIERVD